MVLSECEIRSMVMECVSMILEHHHSIDKSLEKLAELIDEKYHEGGGFISTEEINAINPYFSVKSPLVVSVVSNDEFVASYNVKTNEIEINEKKYNGKFSSKETIMHELSHFIDLNARTKPLNPPTQYTPNGPIDLPVKFSNDILYFFRPTEIQARLTQFTYFLKSNPDCAKKDLSSFENEKVLKADYMSTLIEIVEGSDYYKASGEIVQILANSASYNRVKKRGGGYERSAFLDNMSESEFNVQKQKIISILKKRLKSFKQKALKIKYDFFAKD